MPDDVLIAGGGLVGCLAALRLAEHGARCTVIDARAPLTGASLNNAGGLYFQLQPQATTFDAVQTRKLSRLAALIGAAHGAWERLGPALDETGLRYRGGGVILADDEAGEAALRQKHLQENAWGLRTEWLDAAAVRALSPAYAPQVRCGTFSADEGYCDTRALSRSVLAALHSHDRIRVRAGAAIVDAEHVGAAQDGGRFRLALADGERLSAGRLLLCLGAFGGEILRMLGLDPAVMPLPLQIHALQAPAGTVPIFTRYASQRLSLKQYRSGEVIVGGGWPADPDPDDAMAVRFSAQSEGRNLDLAARLVPALRGLSCVTRRGGWAAWTPDGLPNLGGYAAMPGVYTAFGGNGYTLAPLYAEVLCALALGRTPALPLDAFAPDRHAGAGDGAQLPPDG